MATQYTKSWKVCATCAYWLGARECDRWGEKVTVDSSTATKGKCAAPSGMWKNAERQACSNCNGWQKWPVLK